MRKYEILMLLRPNLEADVKSKTIEQAEKLIGGNIVKKEE
jgi:ribosomal protein S6